MASMLASTATGSSMSSVAGYTAGSYIICASLCLCSYLATEIYKNEINQSYNHYLIGVWCCFSIFLASSIAMAIYSENSQVIMGTLGCALLTIIFSSCLIFCVILVQE